MDDVRSADQVASEASAQTGPLCATRSERLLNFEAAMDKAKNCLWKREIRRRLASLRLEPTREAEIVEELAQHLEDRYAQMLSGGAAPEEAYSAALAELSESESLEREMRRVERQFAQEPIALGSNRRTNMLTDLWQDLRFGA